MLNQKLLDNLPALYETDGVKGDLPAVYIESLIAPQMKWVVWEYNPETNEAFGLCDLGMGFPEIGYVPISDIMQAAPILHKTTRFKGYHRADVDVPEWLEA